MLENDSHWDQTLKDAVISSKAKQIGTLFFIILFTCVPSTPIDLWNKYKHHMAKDIFHQMRLQPKYGYYTLMKVVNDETGGIFS